MRQRIHLTVAAPRTPASPTAERAAGPTRNSGTSARGHDLRRIRVAPPAAAPAAAVSAPGQAHGVIQPFGWRDLVPSRSSALLAGAVGLGAGLLGGTGVGLLAGAGVYGATTLYRGWSRRRLAAHREEARRLRADYAAAHLQEQEALGQWRHAGSDRDREEAHAELRRLDAVRRRLVGRTLAGGHELWLPGGIDEVEAGRARALWDSIRGDRGNVKIRGSREFRTNVLADVTKLLQSQHGRDMLADLNRAQGGDRSREVRIGSFWRGVYERDEGGSWARPIGDSAGAVSPEHGQFGTGAGSHVQIDYGAPTGLLAGEHDEPLHQPSYITLGHELGHARRNLLGRKRQVGHWGRKGDPTEAAEQDLWSKDPEEFENITKEENPLRVQLGLPARRYHRGHSAVVVSRRKTELRQRYLAAYQRLGWDAQDLPTHDAAEAWGMYHPTVDWDSPNAVRDAERAVSAFERQVERKEKEQTLH